ncbi:MAG: metallophosphoesterase [Pirellulales bacterium]|nr:metallophosphoesterase [Pirellulales bacterium]
MRFVYITALTTIVSVSSVNAVEQKEASTWTFVSIPDFLNVDTIYPEPKWEDALSYTLKSIKSENPDFVLVAGDEVMGHWDYPENRLDTGEKVEGEEGVRYWASVYYPAWKKRFEAHGLLVYTAIGDHEIGDNPWPLESRRLRCVPEYKRMFAKYLMMPKNGPDHMKGTAFYVKHKNVLIVSVDVFEEGRSKQGGIAAQVTGEQLEWLDATLKENIDVDHVVVMGHTPIVGPVRMRSSSGLMLENRTASTFWQMMKKHKVELYLCGEVHAITCHFKDGIQQIAHGGLYGYNSQMNYLVCTVHLDRIEMELKEIDIVNSGPAKWQVDLNRPRESVTMTAEVKKAGYRTVGKATLTTSGERNTVTGISGFFDESNNPRKKK